MTRKKLSITISISFLALIGIIALQLHWIRAAYVQNKINFEQNLNKALNQIVLDLSHQENIFFDSEMNQVVELYGNVPKIIKLSNDSGKKFIWQSKSVNVNTVSNENKALESKKKEFQHKLTKLPLERKIVIHQKSDNYEFVQEVQFDSLLKDFDSKKEFRSSAFALFKKDSLLRKYEVYIDSIKNVLDVNVISIEKKKKDLNKTMHELILNIKSVTRPFSERIPTDKLQKSIEKAIVQFDLPKIYAYAIKAVSADSFLLKSPNFNVSDINKIDHVQLFPHSVVSQSEFLYLSFPDSNPIFKKMLWPIILAFIFTLLLFSSLLIIINNLLHHKKLSAIKTDFINNMTHEFKTPIATIQLASDSVVNEKVLHDPDRINYFMRMIKSENKRMNSLVERILQMAQIEKASFTLIKSEVNIHQLIEAVVENSKLKIEQVEGNYKLKLLAETDTLILDEMHITSVLFNLIENAIKYRGDNLLIEISTAVSNKFFLISIKDNGKGMTKDTSSQIFDKFYRLTDGNIHEVKGYGLGLSYVKTIIEKHSGRIEVKSRIGEGSSFDIYLPLKS
ncbi:MAG: HAMP domain-containing sensor histidine kinase [Bacteroidota bacterium]